MKINQTSAKDRKYVVRPNSVEFHPNNKYFPGQVRRNYRKLRKAGLNTWEARSIIWDNLWLGSIHTITFNAGEINS